MSGDGGWGFVKSLFGDRVNRLSVPGATKDGQTIEVGLSDGSAIVVRRKTLDEAWGALEALASSPSTTEGAG